MSKRNGTVTDDYDREHRRRFVAKARSTSPTFRGGRAMSGVSRQVARNLWAQRVRGADIGRWLGGIFDEISGEMSEGIAA